MRRDFVPINATVQSEPSSTAMLHLLDLRPWLIGSTHELLVTRVFAEDGCLTPCLGLPSSLFLSSMGEPRPTWEARMDVLERRGAVACRDDRGRRRGRVAHLARQVEEVYYKAKRDDRSTSLSPPLTGGWNWSFQGVSAAHVLPKVTSDRPLCSPRGERELAFCIDGVQPPSSVVHNCG